MKVESLIARKERRVDSSGEERQAGGGTCSKELQQVIGCSALSGKGEELEELVMALDGKERSWKNL